LGKVLKRGAKKLRGAKKPGEGGVEWGNKKWNAETKKKRTLVSQAKATRSKRKRTYQGTWVEKKRGVATEVRGGVIEVYLPDSSPPNAKVRPRKQGGHMAPERGVPAAAGPRFAPVKGGGKLSTKQPVAQAVFQKTFGE